MCPAHLLSHVTFLLLEEDTHVLRNGKPSCLSSNFNTPWQSRLGGCKPLSLYGVGLYYKSTFNTLTSNLCPWQDSEDFFFLRFVTRAVTSLWCFRDNDLMCSNLSYFYRLKSRIHGSSIRKMRESFSMTAAHLNSLASVASLCKGARFFHFLNFCGLFVLLVFYRQAQFLAHLPTLF